MTLYVNKLTPYGWLLFFVNKEMFIKNILISFVVMFVLVGVLISPAMACSTQVIANANVTSITKSQLRQIFLMRQLYWPDKQKIVVFVLPSSDPLHQIFSKCNLGIFPYKLDRTWNKLTYSGLGVAPIVVDSHQALIKAVTTTAGAIGYAEECAEIKDKYVIQFQS